MAAWTRRKYTQYAAFVSLSPASTDSAKFLENIEIPWLGSKFRFRQKTMVPNYDDDGDS